MVRKMFTCMDYAQFCALAQQAPRVAVYDCLPADQLTVVMAYQRLATEKGPSFILESSDERGDEGRYSFVGMDPQLLIEAFGRQVRVSRPDAEEKLETDPLDLLQEMSLKRRVAAPSHLPPNVGGAIGYMAYDAVRLLERIPDRHRSDDDLPDLRVGFFDALVAFDHREQKVYLIRLVDVGDDPETAYDQAVQELRKMRAQLLCARTASEIPESPACEVCVDINDDDFCRMVECAQEHIAAGDVFQVVLSRSFQVPCAATPLDVYRALRMTNPSPYLFFLRFDDFSVAGASPERLVSVRERVVETNPIAGTCRRSDEVPDAVLGDRFRSDPKEMAEHSMLVDLARNDLGRICEPGSVKICELAATQVLSRVVHLTSRVEGILAENCTALDALRAAFPAGTLSGAPKIRAMELIDQYEVSRRGLYGGAIFYLDNRGNLDSCIAIRMAVLRDGMATVRAGAGVVYDSDPLSEAQETRHKASAVLQALAVAEEGLPCSC